MRLHVSPDGHFLQHADGTPFFYLADTAWMPVGFGRQWAIEPEHRAFFDDYDPESGVCQQILENDNEGIFRHIPSRRLDTLLVIDAVESDATA